MMLSTKKKETQGYILKAIFRLMAHALTIIKEALICILNLLQSLREWINLDSLPLISAGVSFLTRMKSEKKLLLTLKRKGWQLKGSKYYFTRRNVWQYCNMLYLQEKSVLKPLN